MLRILYVDDEPGLLEICKVFLEATAGFTVDTLTTACDALPTLPQKHYDAIVSDYQMPDMDGIAFLKAVRASGNTIPFILFTGRGREEIIIDAINNGADFYLQKGGDPKAQFAELAHKIRQSVQRRMDETSIREHERREADILNFLPDATFAIDRAGTVIAWNKAIEEMTGVPALKMLGKGDYEYAIPFYHERRPILINLVLKDDAVTAGKYPYFKRDGQTLFSEITIPHFDNGRGSVLWFTATPLFDMKGRIVGAIESIRDITERRKAEDELRAAYEQITASDEELKANLDELTRQDQSLRDNEARLRYMLGFYDMVRQPEKEILAYAVDGAGTVTGSPLGYLAFLNEDESELAMHAWSKTSMEECSLREKPLIYPVEKTGLWGEAVRQRRAIITNDYAAPNPKKKGYPDGHPQIVRHMNVPIFDGNHIVIVAGVANRPSDYTENEVRQLTLLMQELWQVLKRHRAEEELRASHEQITASEEELRSQLEEITATQDELKQQQEQLTAIADMIPGVVYQFYARDDGTRGVYYVSRRAAEVFGFPDGVSNFFPWFTAQVDDRDRPGFLSSIDEAVRTVTPWNFEGMFFKPSGEQIWFQGMSRPVRHGNELVFNGILLDITERKRAEEALENRIVALTLPLDDVSGVTFSDLFNLTDIQRLQDEFAAASGVASIITNPDGIPITRPSGFCRLCQDIIRRTDIGLANCYRSDAELGRFSATGPAIQPCMSGGLWDAGAGITVGGQPIANWLIGQVRDETQTEEKMRAYAREIGADEEEVISAFQEVPAMSYDRFRKISSLLFIMANQISSIAYQNVQQARFITERKKAEDALREANKKLSLLSSITRHDICNKLTIQLGLLTLARQKVKDSPEMAAFIGKLESATQAIGSQIEFTRTYQDLGTHEPQWQDLHQTLVKNPVPSEFSVSDDCAGTEVFADVMLEKVFINLIDNAVRHGRSVTTISLTAEEEGGTLIIRFEDNGAGIPDGEKERIFERGYGKNTGLGLFLVREILSITNITIRETGKPGKGARFEMRVPAGAWQYTDKKG